MTRSTSPSTVCHTWTVTQLAHLAACSDLSDYDLARSLRHRFGARVAQLTDRAIRNRRYVLVHAAERAAYARSYRASLATAA